MNIEHTIVSVMAAHLYERLTSQLEETIKWELVERGLVWNVNKPMSIHPFDGTLTLYIDGAKHTVSFL